jgi:hypothetical protein
MLFHVISFLVSAVLLILNVIIKTQYSQLAIYSQGNSQRPAWLSRHTFQPFYIQGTTILAHLSVRPSCLQNLPAIRCAVSVMIPWLNPQ